MAKREVVIEDARGDEADEVTPFRYSISSYGADYPVDGLVRRISDGSIYIPSFQRAFVWTRPQSSRFVESLLLGLPVPGIFLSKEPDTGKLLVIDGQQRLRTLQYFYEGVFSNTGAQFSLKGVQSQFKNCTYRSLRDEDRRRLDDSILHAIVVRQDEPSGDQSSIYYIFERLNTGGTQLHDQEIRACIYHGQFNGLLNDLNKDKAWRAIYGPTSPRMRDQELILRFLALYFDAHDYARPMKEFLNKYMAKNRALEHTSAEKLTAAFTETTKAVHDCLGPKAFKPRTAFNAAMFDSVMIAVANRLSEGPITDCRGVKRKVEQLLKNSAFLAAIQRSTADEESVSRRIKLANQALADIK